MNTGTAVVIGAGVLAAAALGYVYLQRQPQQPQQPIMTAGYVGPSVPIQQGGSVAQFAGGVQALVASAPAVFSEVKNFFGGLFK